MLNVLEFFCDGCRAPATYTDVDSSAAAEQRMANSGWLVTCIGKRMWHFCPVCRAEHSQQRLSPQLTGDSNT